MCGQTQRIERPSDGKRITDGNRVQASAALRIAGSNAGFRSIGDIIRELKLIDGVDRSGPMRPLR